MDIITGIIVGVVFVFVALVIFEYRIRQPDALVLYESGGRIKIRKGLIYSRHFSLSIKRKAQPFQLNIESSAAGNLIVNVKVVGSVAPSPDHLQAMIRAGGWNKDAVQNAAEEAQVLLQGLIQNYTEQYKIQELSSSGVLKYLNDQSSQIVEKVGLDVVALSVLSLEPADSEIAFALRQQEQARLLEQTEKLNHEARAAAAEAKFETDEKIAMMDHALEMKKAELNKELIEEEAAQAQQRLEHELVRNRMRLAYEKEEVEILKGSPELLMLTPQAARLAEASQSLKNARTVISLTPQDLANGPDLLELFQNFLQSALAAKNDNEESE